MHKELQFFLSGRSLLASEIPFDEKILHKQQTLGFIRTIPGIEKKSKRWRCNRCANTAQRLFAYFPCASCKNENGCVYCRNCIMMGRVSICTPLYQWIGPTPTKNFPRYHLQNTFLNTSLLIPKVKFKNVPRDSYLKWEGELSPGQKEASTLAVQAIKNKTELLIWAVCGSGKTEILFEAINVALKQEKRVCIATPRTDVVLELAPRFKQVFPKIRIAALYGGSEDRNMYAPLTISTTHQLLRFHQAFDVMIVDEVDAFPYSFDKSLQWAVEKATKPEASQLLLTATPSEKWQAECKYGKRNFVKIPARYHRHPLPVPTFTWCGDWRKQMEKGNIPKKIASWVKVRIQSEKQALLFLPHIELMEKSLPFFQQIHPNIQAVHSEDPLRKEKVEKMRNKEIPLLLTTTILERGVTFPNIDVAVLGAEDDIFTEAALVQIAGRVGRSATYPTGQVTFFHSGKTKAMVRSLLHIDSMNKEAKKGG